MKSIFKLMATFLAASLLLVQGQIVDDPLHEYYKYHFSQVDFSKENVPDPESPSPPITPQTQIYCLNADFTGEGRKSVFITDEAASLGAHSQYAWSIYCPVSTGGFRLITNSFASGLGGFDYIGYVNEIRRFGIVTGSKYVVIAYYLNNGVLKSQVLDRERGHNNAAYYPKYFHDTKLDWHITTYTVAQLAQKYAGQ